MDNRLEFKHFKIYFIFLFILILIIAYKLPIIGGIAIFLYIILILYTVEMIEKENNKYKKFIENINLDFDSITKQIVFDMPFPLVVIDENNIVVWYNSPFLNEFPNLDIMNSKLNNFISELNENSTESIKEVEINKKTFLAYKNIIDVSKNPSKRNKLITYYFVDDTNYSLLLEKYMNEETIIAKIEIDNYSDAMDSTPQNNRPQLLAEIDNLIQQYFEEYNALIRKFDDDMYLGIMDYESLQKIKNKRFDLLDDLRDLNRGNTIPITLSIGVSDYGKSLREAYLEAETCLDLALGRGGDQAVLKVKDNYEFFGGRSKAIEKRNKVKARVLGIALKQLIDRSKDVFVMGHKHADMDAIGASIGILRATINRNKKGYLVLDSSNPAIDNILNKMKTEEKEMYDMIITDSEAIVKIRKSSLVILVDHHKPSMTECPELLDISSQIVVIDHHRRGKEFVEHPVLSYIEPYASSACELVTEMLVYMSDNINLTHFEANALMSGIVVDTKNFSFQTGVRTFEAASILKRSGADMVKVRELFEDSYEIVKSRAEVIKDSQIIFGDIAISQLKGLKDNGILIVSEAADELLKTEDIKATFIFCQIKNGIHISARSIGDFSVQLILEKIGGGGHRNVAGLDAKDTTMEELKTKLITAIEEYLKENQEERNEDNTIKG